MTLYETIKYLESIALRQPSVEFAGDGDIYSVLNTKPDIKYGVFFITQNNHRLENNANHYNLNLFYIDRLEHNLESNMLQIQSIGKEVLTNIINTFCEGLDAETGTSITFQPFTQQFRDECAGIYAVVELIVDADIECPEEY